MVASSNLFVISDGVGAVWGPVETMTVGPCSGFGIGVLRIAVSRILGAVGGSIFEGEGKRRRSEGSGMGVADAEAQHL